MITRACDEGDVLLLEGEAAKCFCMNGINLCSSVNSHTSVRSFIHEEKDARAPAGSNQNTELYDYPVLISMSDPGSVLAEVLRDNLSFFFFLLRADRSH